MRAKPLSIGKAFPEPEGYPAVFAWIDSDADGLYLAIEVRADLIDSRVSLHAEVTATPSIAQIVFSAAPPRYPAAESDWKLTVAPFMWTVATKPFKRHFAVGVPLSLVPEAQFSVSVTCETQTWRAKYVGTILVPLVESA